MMSCLLSDNKSVLCPHLVFSSRHRLPDRTEALGLDTVVAVELHLHGVVLAGDGAGPRVAAVLLARHLHVVISAAGVGLQGEALEGELDLGAVSHGQVPSP